MQITKSIFTPTYNPTNYMEIDKEKTAFFHMETTGRFWRNSSITSIGLIYFEDGVYHEIIWEETPDQDEYPLLEAFSKEASRFKCLIGYNSASFHIPYLEKKYRAYGLSAPFWNQTQIDLYRKLKDVGKKLHLSMKLSDLKDFIKLPNSNELEMVASLPALFSYDSFFHGDFTLAKSEPLNDEEFLVYLAPAYAFPVAFRYRCDAFYIIGEKDSAKMKIHIYNGKLRVYYPNVEDYYYLPQEDMAIHKSMASYVDKEHKVKADFSNCYTYTPYDESLLSNLTKLEQYVKQLLLSCS